MSNASAADAIDRDADEALVAGFVNQMIDHFQSLNVDVEEEDEEFTAAAQKYRDRRASDRHSFLTVQAIAPRYQGSTPSASDFRSVKCRDLSPSGFAYWTDERPDYKELVTRFHMGKEATLITARIVHVTESAGGEELRYLVGCEFMGKIQA